MPPKRKSAASSSSISKKPKSSSVIVTLGKAALEAHGGGKILNDDQVNELTAYIQHLEARAEAYRNIENSLSRKGGNEPSETDIEAAAQRLRGNVDKGIRKLMKWKPTCKTGSATFAFEGICDTPAIMASFLGLDDVTKFKIKRYTYEEFEDNVIHDTVCGSVRFCTLYLTGNVNLYWNNETGEYKFSGKYGQHGTGKAAK